MSWIRQIGITTSVRSWATAGSAVSDQAIPSASTVFFDGLVGNSSATELVSVSTESSFNTWRLVSIDVFTGGVRELVRQPVINALGAVVGTDDAGRVLFLAEPDVRWEDRLFGEFAGERVLFVFDQAVATPTEPGVEHGSLTDQMSRLYSAYFLREPDTAGLRYWREQRVAGASLLAVSNEFAASAEFEQRYGSLTNEQFIDLVYANVLGRTPDAGGRSYWLAQLSSGLARGDLMLLFSESPEFVAATGTTPSLDPIESEVYRLFVTAFVRRPDEASLEYWTSVRRSGASQFELAQAVIETDEWKRTYGRFTEDGFVVDFLLEATYQNLLGAYPSDQAYETLYSSDIDLFAERSTADVLVLLSNLPDVHLLLDTTS